MNISPVSFYGINKHTPHIKNKKDIKSESRSIQNQSQRKKVYDGAKWLLVGSAAALIINQTTLALTKAPKDVTIPFNPSDKSITDIAKTYNSSEDAIKSYNQISDSDNIDEVTELKIPNSFDYIQVKIEELQKKLHNRNLSSAERSNIENEIAALFLKQQEQKNVATTYADEAFLYIKIDIKLDKLPPFLKDKYQFGINIESLKKLFDIEDGAIEKNNEISYKWVPTSNDGTQGYNDYTLNWFKDGDIIKVPISSINEDNINLNAYSNFK